MAHQQDLRRTPRIVLNSGNVFLYAGGLPPISCRLLDLSETGCRCVFPMASLVTANAAMWLTILRPGQRLESEVSVIPYFLGYRFHCEVKEVSKVQGDAILSVMFYNVEVSQRARLRDGLSEFSKRNAPGARTEELKSAAAPQKEESVAGLRIGEILVKQAKLTQEQLVAALASRQNSTKIGRYLVNRGLVEPRDLLHALSKQLRMQTIDLKGAQISPHTAACLPYLTKLRYGFVPFFANGQSVQIATTQALPRDVIEELEKKDKRQIRVYLAEDEIVFKLLADLKPVDQRRQRKVMRHPVSLPVSFRFCDRNGDFTDDRIHLGTTLNASDSGLAIVPRGDVTGKGEYLRATVAIDDATLDGLYRIKHIQKQSIGDEDCGWQIGLQNLEMEVRDRVRLHSYCLRAPANERTTEFRPVALDSGFSRIRMYGTMAR